MKTLTTEQMNEIAKTPCHFWTRNRKLSFEGVMTFKALCDKYSDRLFLKNYEEEDFNKDGIYDCCGNEVSWDAWNDTYGSLNFDNEYDSHSVISLEDVVKYEGEELECLLENISWLIEDEVAYLKAMGCIEEEEEEDEE